MHLRDKPELLKSYLDLALRAAVAAGFEILDVYAKDFEVDFKADDTPLTEADRRAHTVISRMLGAAAAGSSAAPAGAAAAPAVLPILSEEAAHQPFAEREGWGAFWLVDPLDGTKEFVKRNGEFTVNIALVEKGEPIMGVVYAPHLGELYWGGIGLGAFKLRNNSPSRFHVMAESGTLTNHGTALPDPAAGRTRSGAPRPFTVVASRSHMSPETEAYVQAQRAEHPELQLVSAGSALKLCLVAEGSAELYPRFAPTMEWDTGAGHAVAVAAGCSVDEHPAGTPLRYNKENLVNPWFLVAAPQIAT
ncbi:MAG: 3'(2'),5'-bisphosphate nucleotidase [Spirochaetaceae bacterium]|nr:MAG: 3'(2'),5'-bisphosphate nucleotidase [Spirochaetaceae bacterium]